MKKSSVLFLGLLAMASVVRADEPAPASPNHAATTAADRSGIVVNAYVGADLHRWTGTNSSASLSLPAGGAIVDYFFGEVFGVYAGVDYVKRGAALAGASHSANFIDAMAGIALRYRGNLFSSTSLNIAHIGLLSAFPLDSFSGTLAVPGNGITQMYMGLATQASSVYPIGGGMWLGPASWVKIGLGNPVAGLAVSAWYVDVGLGLQLTF